jgi:hypothetical protein
MECPEFRAQRRIPRQACLQALALSFTQLAIQVCREKLGALFFFAFPSPQ